MFPICELDIFIRPQMLTDTINFYHCNRLLPSLQDLIFIKRLYFLNFSVSANHPETDSGGMGRQPFAGAFSTDEIQSLEELDSERLSANWHDSSS